MPRYKFTDSQSGKSIILTGDSPPSEEELNEIFSSVRPQEEQTQPGTIGTMARRAGEFLVKTPTLPMVGGVVGGIAGGGFASIPLAGIGAAGGEGYRIALGRQLGMDVPPTGIQPLKRIGKEALTSAIGQTLGLGVGKTASGAGKLLAPIGKKVVDSLSAATGVPTQGFKALIEKPSRLLTSGQQNIKHVGQKIGEIIESTIQKDMTPDVAAKSLVDRAFQTPGASRTVAKKVALKMAEGKPVTDTEVAMANRAINTVINNTTDDGTKALLRGQKSVFQDYLADKLPTLKELNNEYSTLKSVSAFRSLGRLNKSGKTSRLGMMFLLAAAKHPLIALTSPAVVGTGVAAAATAGKAAASPAITGTIGQVIARTETAKKLTREIAKDYLKKAKKLFKGTKASPDDIRDKARELARGDHYIWD